MKKFLRTAACLSVSTIAIVATAAQAQDNGTVGTSASDQQVEAQARAYGDIIVTANRREQALQDTPLSVTAITADALIDKGVKSLGDLSIGSIPGMQIVPFAGTSSILAINARGIGLSDTTQGTQEMAVPVYIDGVPLGRAQGLGLELINPERIEFLRGPQGQLFGRNAEGGAIQFVSKRPSGKMAVDATASYGNYNADRERLSFDLPEFAGIRLQGSIVHAHHDAYTKNEPEAGFSSQADYGYLRSFGWRIAGEINPTDWFRANYSYDDTDIKDSQPYMVWVPVDIVGRTPYSPMPAGDDEYPDVVNSPTFNEYFKSVSRGHALTLSFFPSEVTTVKSITSYRESGRHGSSTLGDALIAGGSSTGIIRTNAREDVDQKQWYQELQGFMDWGSLNLTVGGTYFQEKVSDRRRSYLTGQGFNPPALGLSPAVLAGCIGLETCFTAHSEQDAKSDSYGAYAQATWVPPVLGEKLELTAGIRYSDDKKVAERTYIQPPMLPPLTEATPSGALPPFAVFHAKRWDPAVTLKYNFSDDVNAYVRYATAYRAGGANVRSSTFTSYGAEEVKAWEAGIKSRLLDRRMTFNLVWFHNKLTSYQANIQEAPTTNPSLTNTVNLVDPVNIWGIEVESGIRVTEGLTINGNYAYTNTRKWDEIDNPLTAAVDITRFYTIQSPKHAGNIGFDYDSPSFGFASLSAHADYSFSSGYWTTPGGLRVSTLGPNYERPQTKTSMLNGRLALKDIAVGGGEAEIAVFGKNLLDETYYTYAFDGAASGGGFAEFLQPPRTYGVELRVKY